VPAAFNDLVHVDFVGPLRTGTGDNAFIISMTDAFTRWPEAAVVSCQTAETAAQAVLRWVCRFGQPRRLTSDRGTPFVGEVLTCLSAFLGVERLRTTPYHPHNNGLEERAHRTMADIIATMSAKLDNQPHE
jgi:hypothetical protein